MKHIYLNILRQGLQTIKTSKLTRKSAIQTKRFDNESARVSGEENLTLPFVLPSPARHPPERDNIKPDRGRSKAFPSIIFAKVAYRLLLCNSCPNGQTLACCPLRTPKKCKRFFGLACCHGVSPIAVPPQAGPTAPLTRGHLDGI